MILQFSFLMILQFSFLILVLTNFVTANTNEIKHLCFQVTGGSSRRAVTALSIVSVSLAIAIVLVLVSSTWYVTYWKRTCEDGDGKPQEAVIFKICCSTQ